MLVRLWLWLLWRLMKMLIAVKEEFCKAVQSLDNVVVEFEAVDAHDCLNVVR